MADPLREKRAVSRQGAPRPLSVHPSVRPTTAPTPPTITRPPQGGTSKVRTRVHRLKNLNVETPTCVPFEVEHDTKPELDETGISPIKAQEVMSTRRLLPPMQSPIRTDSAAEALSDITQKSDPNAGAVVVDGKQSLYSPFGEPLRVLRQTWSVHTKPSVPVTAAAKKVRKKKKVKPQTSAPEVELETPKAIAALESFHNQIKSAQGVLDQYASLMRRTQKARQESSDSEQNSLTSPLATPIIRGALVLNRRHALKIAVDSTKFSSTKRASLNCEDDVQIGESGGDCGAVAETDATRDGQHSNATIVSAEQFVSMAKQPVGANDEQDWEDIPEDSSHARTESAKVVTNGLLSKRARRQSWMRSAHMRKSYESIKNLQNQTASGNRAWLNAEHMRNSSESMTGRSTASRRSSTCSRRSWLSSGHMRMSTESMQSDTDQPVVLSNRRSWLNSGHMRASTESMSSATDEPATNSNRRAWLNSGHMRASAETVYNSRSWLQSGAMRSSTQSIGNGDGRRAWLQSGAMRSSAQSIGDGDVRNASHRSRRSSRVYSSRFTVVISDQPEEKPPPPTPNPELLLIALEEERKREQILAKRKANLSERRGSILLTALKSEIRQELRKEMPSIPPIGMMHLGFRQACQERSDKARMGLT